MSKRRILFGLLLMLTALLMAFTTASAATSADSITNNDTTLEKIPGSVLTKLTNNVQIRQEHIHLDSITAPTFKLPAGLQIIEDEAFEGTAIVVIDLPETVESIGEQAFANIATLRKVNIPEKTKQIARTAFAGSNNVTITGAPGSYARTWARENAIPFTPILVMYAGTDDLLLSGYFTTQNNIIDLNSRITGKNQNNHQWRPVEENKAEHSKEFKTNHVLGRAPPAKA